jgi:hypothetical protein
MSKHWEAGETWTTVEKPVLQFGARNYDKLSNFDSNALFNALFMLLVAPQQIPADM